MYVCMYVCMYIGFLVAACPVANSIRRYVFGLTATALRTLQVTPGGDLTQRMWVASPHLRRAVSVPNFLVPI